MLMKFAGRISTTRLTTKASPLLGVHNSLELTILFPNSSTSEFTRDNNRNYNPPPLVRLPSPHQGGLEQLSILPSSIFSSITNISMMIITEHHPHHLIVSPPPLLSKVFLLRAKFCLHLSSRKTDKGPPEKLLE